ncbi:uncharacterized protein [Branchiostoma lanceolatum]|uniref:uncharacterized protein n=1 Tax=Branchiostoma lanceolatum TaxID=7740 RepID=UPI00113306A1
MASWSVVCSVKPRIFNQDLGETYTVTFKGVTVQESWSAMGCCESCGDCCRCCCGWLWAVFWFFVLVLVGIPLALWLSVLYVLFLPFIACCDCCHGCAEALLSGIHLPLSYARFMLHQRSLCRVCCGPQEWP